MVVISYKIFKWTEFYYKNWFQWFWVLLSNSYETILTRVTFYFRSRNLNESVGRRRALYTNWWLPRPMHFFMTHLPYERQRASFVSLSLLHTLRKGGGLLVIKTESHKYIAGERERPSFASLSLIHTLFLFSRFISFFTLFSLFNSSNIIGLCSWSPSCPGACGAVRHEGLWQDSKQRFY